MSFNYTFQSNKFESKLDQSASYMRVSNNDIYIFFFFKIITLNTKNFVEFGLILLSTYNFNDIVNI